MVGGRRTEKNGNVRGAKTDGNLVVEEAMIESSKVGGGFEIVGIKPFADEKIVRTIIVWFCIVVFIICVIIYIACAFILGLNDYIGYDDTWYAPAVWLLPFGMMHLTIALGYMKTTKDPCPVLACLVITFILCLGFFIYDAIVIHCAQFNIDASNTMCYVLCDHAFCRRSGWALASRSFNLVFMFIGMLWCGWIWRKVNIYPLPFPIRSDKIVFFYLL